MFDQTSRYANLPVLKLTAPDGRETAYVARRFLPDPATLGEMMTVRVTDSDRLDLIAYRTLGDPRLFWRIADANRAMDPQDLTADIGRKLRIPQP